MSLTTEPYPIFIKFLHLYKLFFLLKSRFWFLNQFAYFSKYTHLSPFHGNVSVLSETTSTTGSQTICLLLPSSAVSASAQIWTLVLCQLQRCSCAKLGLSGAPIPDRGTGSDASWPNHHSFIDFIQKISAMCFLHPKEVNCQKPMIQR